MSKRKYYIYWLNSTDLARIRTLNGKKIQFKLFKYCLLIRLYKIQVVVR